MVLTLWPKVRATKLDQLLSQWVTSGGQELSIIRIVVTHAMEGADDLVFVLDVVNQVI